jgi:hypothetical protein
MCYERRRAEACVDESAHHALGQTCCVLSLLKNARSLARARALPLSLSLSLSLFLSPSLARSLARALSLSLSLLACGHPVTSS